MINRITIRDVAEEAGVSISTVHQALNGKKGVSEETRRRIQDIASELGYQPNMMASGLKRKPKHIGVFFPRSSYYKTVWKGAREYLESVPNINLESTEMPFDESERPEKNRDRIMALIREKSIDGILITGHSGFMEKKDWQELEGKQIAVALLGADDIQSRRIYCVLPNYEIIGKTMAELILGRIPPFGSIALCAGNPKWEPHAKVVQGFTSYMRETGAPNQIYYNNSWDVRDDSYFDILQLLSRPDIAACCSVLAQSSVLLGKALVETRKSGKVFAVGSDLSSDNVAFLRDGTFHNLIQKNPYAQGYLGAKNLVEYLTLGRKPEPDKTFVGSEVVFRSNLAMYQDISYRSLFS